MSNPQNDKAPDLSMHARALLGYWARTYQQAQFTVEYDEADDRHFLRELAGKGLVTCIVDADVQGTWNVTELGLSVSASSH